MKHANGNSLEQEGEGRIAESLFIHPARFPANAEMVRDDIIDLTIDLPNYPEKHPLDKFKKDNDGTWRAFEKHHYRVSYRITPNEIRIVRLRHTSKSPLNF